MSEPSLPPHAPSVVGDTEQPPEHIQEQVITACCQLLPGWKALPRESFKISTVSGGKTYMMLKVEPPSCTDTDAAAIAQAPVVVRLYGRNTEVFIDRSRELRTLARVASHGVGSRVLASFATGRIESFLQGRSLEPVELAEPPVAALAAEAIAGLHVIPAMEVMPQLWTTLRSFYKQAQGVEWKSEKQREKFEKLQVGQYLEELQMLEQMNEKLQSNVVLCHNDLLCGNFMYHREVASMQLIDFEYACCGYRGYDIGNHFNEYAGFECEYDRCI